MQEDRKPDVLKRLSYIEGHIAGIRKMVEEDIQIPTSVVGGTVPPIWFSSATRWYGSSGNVQQ